MLYVTQNTAPVAAAEPDTQSAAQEISLSWMIEAVRRRILAVILAVVVAGALGATYVMIRPSNYTAFTQLQLTNLRLTFSRDDAFFAESQVEPTFLETQIQIMRTRKIAQAALATLPPKEEEPLGWFSKTLLSITGLPEQPVAEGSHSLLEIVVRKLTGQAIPSVEEAAQVGMAAHELAALKALMVSYSVERVGLSNIVEIRFTSNKPEDSARGANAIAAAYIEDQESARVESAQSGSVWLRERLREVGPRTRIVAQATAPTDKSDPRGILIVALALIGGGMLGVAYALGRQWIDRSVRTPEQAEAAAGAECLGIVPRLPLPRGLVAAYRSSAQGSAALPLMSGRRGRAFADLWRTLHNTQVALDDSQSDQAARCIGFTATFANEGASTLAINYARFLASQGKRVLLIDCDPVNHTLTKALQAVGAPGLVDVMQDEDENALSIAVRTDARNGMAFLPLGRIARGGGLESSRTEVVWSENMSAFLNRALQDYDVIVCDLPPLASIGDVRAASRYLDRFVLVAEYGRINATHLQTGVRSAGAFHDKLAGIVLNKAQMSEVRRAASPGSAFFGHRQSMSRNRGLAGGFGLRPSKTV